MEHNSSKAGVVLIAIIALLIGGFGGYALSKNSHDDQSTKQSTAATAPNTMTKAADVRVTLNNVLRQHVSTSLTVTRNIVDGSKDLQASLDAQTANAVDVANAVGSVYGDEAKAKITPLFVDHIEQSNNFAKAVAAGDPNAKQASLTELQDYLHKISAFFSGAIKNLPEATVYDVLNKHEELLNQSIEAYAAGDFARSYSIERDAMTQISGVADVLAKGIVATVPDKF